MHMAQIYSALLMPTSNMQTAYLIFLWSHIHKMRIDDRFSTVQCSTGQDTTEGKSRDPKMNEIVFLELPGRGVRFMLLKTS